MADKYIQQLTDDTSPALADEMVIQKAADTTELKRSDIQTVLALYNGLAATMTNKTLTAPTIEGGTVGNTTPVTIIKVDNLTIDGNTITSTDTNGNIVLTPDGAGVVATDNLSFDGNTIASTNVDGNIVLTPNGAGVVTTDNLSFDGNTIASTNTDGNIVLAPNGTGVVTTDNLSFDGNTIASTDVDGNINLTPNGSGLVVIGALDANGGTIDGVVVNGGSAGVTTPLTQLVVDNIDINGNTIISTDTNGDINITPNGTGKVVAGKALSGSSDILTTGGIIGYDTGTGGTITQITSRTTGVTLNTTNGAITLVSAAGSTSWQTFTVTNSTVAATDTVLVVQQSGTDLNMIHVTNVSAGSFDITFATTGGTTTEQPVFNFAVINGVTS